MSRVASRSPTLILATSTGSGAKLRHILPKLGINEWVGLAPDYDPLVHLEVELGEVAIRRSIGAQLQERARMLRRPFFELTSNFARKYNSLAWWSMGIGERCTNTSNLFLHCCYLSLAQEYLQSGKGLCIVCDSPALRAAIGAAARRQGYSVRRLGNPLPAFKETPVRPVLALAWRLGNLLLRWLILRAERFRSPFGPRKRPRPDVVLSTWVDKESLDKSGRVKDRYLPGLTEFYQSKGISAATILTITESLPTFLRMVFKLGNNPEYIVPEAYLRLTDFAFPLRLWLHQRSFSFRGATLCELNVSHLFEAAKRNESMETIASLQYPLMRRLANAGVRPSLIVLGFENMVSDKMTILGARRFMPGTQVYGYVHMPLKPNVLSCYTDVHERDFAPLPDRLICIGLRYRDILIREHYPPNRIVVGAALRYSYLHRNGKLIKDGEHAHQGRRPAILIILTLKRDATLELIEKVSQGVRGLDVDILVKPHPFALDLADTARSRLGDHVQIVTGSMDDALARADAVVCAASGTALEAALLGKPVIQVSSESQLDMDPLAWFEEFGQPVAGGEELERRLNEVLNGTNDRRLPRMNASEISSFFAPPTEEYMKVFLPTPTPTESKLT